MISLRTVRIVTSLVPGERNAKGKNVFIVFLLHHFSRKVTHWEPCEGCPYGKHSPCLGYCIVKAMKEVKEHRNTG